MDYLLSNLSVEIDVDDSNFENSIVFKVQNNQLSTVWQVEHTIEAIVNLPFMLPPLPEQIEHRLNWAIEICKVLNANLADDRVIHFFKCKPRSSRKQVSSRSFSQFNLMAQFTTINSDIRSTSRYTLSQHKKLYSQILVDYQVTFSELRTLYDCDRFLKSLHYREIRLVGHGAQAYAFKVINPNDQLVAVKLMQKTPETLKAALLQQQINEDVVNNLSGCTLLQHKILEVEDILLIEEELASHSLEDILQKRTQSCERFSDEEIRNIIYDMAEQLYNLHLVRQSAHNDIKPENILLQEQRYILHDYGAVKPASDAEVEISEITGTPLYMSPRKLAHFQNQRVDMPYTQVSLRMHSVSVHGRHNPLKSDIYSLGLVLLRLLLHNDDVRTQLQVETIFHHNRQENIPKMLERYSFDVHSERVVLFEQGPMRIKSLLHLMLEEEEENRISTLELACLLHTPILSTIHTPYTSFFLPHVVQLSDLTTKVTYSLKNLVYVGEFDAAKNQRTGNGKISRLKDSYNLRFSEYRSQRRNQTIVEEEESEYSDVAEVNSMELSCVLYDGKWRNNLPHGKGVYNFYSYGNDTTYMEKSSEVGKIVSNAKQSFQNFEFSMESNFYYGLLHGIVKYQGKETRYILNISQDCCEPLKLRKQYYKFSYDKDTDVVFGYEGYSDNIVIDISTIEDVSIIERILEKLVRQIKATNCVFYSQGDLKEFRLTDELSTFHIVFRAKEAIKKKKMVYAPEKRNSDFGALCCIKTKNKIVEEVFGPVQTDEIETLILSIILRLQASSLSILRLILCQFRDAALELLQSDQYYIRIKELNFNGSSIEDRVIAKILSSQNAIYIRNLNISNTAAGSLTIDSLKASENELTRLFVSNCLNCFRFHEYIESGKASKLIQLDISSNAWVDFEFLKCMQLTYLPSLAELSISDCKIRAEAFRETSLGKKVHLFRPGTQCENVIVQQEFPLQNSLLNQVRCLERWGFPNERDHRNNESITDETLRVLGKSQGLQKVIKLKLRGQYISEKGMQAVLQSPFISSIEMIDLSDTPVRGEVLKHIAESPSLSHIRKLIMKNCNQIDAESLQRFTRSVKGAQIKAFIFRSELVSTKKLVESLKQLPHLKTTEVTMHTDERDAAAVLKMTLSWVSGLVLIGRLKKFVLYLKGQNSVGDGFEIFVKEVQNFGQSDCSIKITVQSCKSIPPNVIESLKSVKQISLNEGI